MSITLSTCVQRLQPFCNPLLVKPMVGGLYQMQRPWKGTASLLLPSAHKHLLGSYLSVITAWPIYSCCKERSFNEKQDGFNNSLLLSKGTYSQEADFSLSRMLSLDSLDSSLLVLSVSYFTLSLEQNAELQATVNTLKPTIIGRRQDRQKYFYTEQKRRVGISLRA